MNDKNGFIEILVIIIVVIVTCVATLTFLIVCLMKYAPCFQNYLQRKNINIPFLRQTTHDACVKCQLIEMGREEHANSFYKLSLLHNHPDLLIFQDIIGLEGKPLCADQL